MKASLSPTSITYSLTPSVSFLSVPKKDGVVIEVFAIILSALMEVAAVRLPALTSPVVSMVALPALIPCVLSCWSI